MKKAIMIILVCLIFVSCGAMIVRHSLTSDLTCYTSANFWVASSIYFDSYEILEDGKYMFFDKDGKYAGEIYPYDGFYIKRNSYKRVSK